MSHTENASPPEPFHAILLSVFLSTSMAFVDCRPGGEAVVIASRDAKDVMRKLMAMEKIFAKKQENEQ